jgi:hypothetical protein
MECEKICNNCDGVIGQLKKIEKNCTNYTGKASLLPSEGSSREVEVVKGEWCPVGLWFLSPDWLKFIRYI